MAKKMYTVTHFNRDSRVVVPFEKVERTMEEAKRAVIGHHKILFKAHTTENEHKLRLITEEPGYRAYDSEYNDDWEWYIREVDAPARPGKVYTVTFLDRDEKLVDMFREAYGSWEAADAGIRKNLQELSDGEADEYLLTHAMGRSGNVKMYKISDYNEYWRWVVKEAEYK